MGVRTVAGLLSLFGMLALSSPGVRAERVEAPDAEADAGPQCASDRPVAATQLDAFLSDLRREQWGRHLAEAEARGIVVLNGRGFNQAGNGVATAPPTAAEIR